MAYFANSSEGSCFDEQCSQCKYGMAPCPIAAVQMLYNYDAFNNEIATKILDTLVQEDGTCEMWEMCKSDFAIDPNQLELNFLKEQNYEIIHNLTKIHSQIRHKKEMGYCSFYDSQKQRRQLFKI